MPRDKNNKIKEMPEVCQGCTYDSSMCKTCGHYPKDDDFEIDMEHDKSDNPISIII